MINRFSFAFLLPALVSVLMFATGATAKEQEVLILHSKKSDPHTKNNKVVLISGDEEYRSEEALPQLAKILSTQHGFDCVVLFAIHPQTGQIDPNVRDNIPGMEHLRDADALVIATRFRDLPAQQMKELDQYLRRGGPVVGMRTATHGFNIPAKKNTRIMATDIKEYKSFGAAVSGGQFLVKSGFRTMVRIVSKAHGG